MSAVRRVAGAPGWILLIVAIQWLAAAVIGGNLRYAVGITLKGFAAATDGHLLVAVAELLRLHPGIISGLRHALVGSSVIALGLFVLLSPAVIHRLAAKRPAARTAAAALRDLPAATVVTLWHLLPRAVLLVAVGAAANRLLSEEHWGLLALAGLALTLGYCTCALDLARCHVLLHGARRFHFKTALDGYLEALRRPSVLVRSLLCSLGQWACALGMIALAIDHAGGGATIWLIRGLSLVGVVLALTRVAVAVDAGRPAG